MNDLIYGLKLSIYINSNDKFEKTNLANYIIKCAFEAKINGATLINGSMGYGNHHQMHSINILSLSDKLPQVLIFIDTQEKIAQFIETLKSKEIKFFYTIDETKFNKI